jgi:hypothetical protein
MSHGSPYKYSLEVRERAGIPDGIKDPIGNVRHLWDSIERLKELKNEVDIILSNESISIDTKMRCKNLLININGVMSGIYSFVDTTWGEYKHSVFTEGKFIKEFMEELRIFHHEMRIDIKNERSME